MTAATRKAGLVTSMIAALILAALPSGAALAEEDPPFAVGASPAWFLLGGVTGGTTLAAGRSGGFAGGELSLVRLREGRFAGLYADSYYDFGLAATYVSAGPEVGFHVRGRGPIPLSFGIDGGFALRFDDDSQVGASGRFSVTAFGLFSIYGRYSYLDADDNEHVLQAGVMLKFPLASPFGRGAVQ